MKEDNVALGAPRYCHVTCICTMYTKKPPKHYHQNLLPLTENQLQTDYKAAINEIRITPDGKKSRCVSVTLLYNRLHIVVQDELRAASCCNSRFRQRLFSSFNQMQNPPRIFLHLTGSDWEPTHKKRPKHIPQIESVFVRGVFSSLVPV